MKPIFANDYICLVLCSDDKYVPYLSSLLCSVVENTSPTHYYDIIVLSDDISEDNSIIIQSFASQNISIRILSVDDIVKDLHCPIPNEKWSRVIYFRLLIPYILSEYSRVVYLDCDIINCDDIANLYSVDLMGKSIGAVRNLGMANYGNNTLNYFYRVFTDKHPDIDISEYFNSGVMVMDLVKIRKKYSLSYVKNRIEKNEYDLPDQDLLNELFRNDVFFVDASWNAYPYTKKELENAVGNVCPESLRTYYNSLFVKRKNIHYITNTKPWLEPFGEKAKTSSYFWKYLFKTPYINEVTSRMKEWQIRKECIASIYRNDIDKLMLAIRKDSKVVLYGYGKNAVRFFKQYGNVIPVSCIIDKSYKKQTSADGLEIISPSEMDYFDKKKTVIIISNNAFEDIAFDLFERGFSELFSFICLNKECFKSWIPSHNDYLFIQKTFACLADERSSDIFSELINHREKSIVDWNTRYIDVYEPNGYFRDDFMLYSDKEDFVNIGSENGVIISSFIDFVSNHYNSIRAFVCSDLEEMNLKNRFADRRFACCNFVRNKEVVTLDGLIGTSKVSLIRIDYNSQETLLGARHIIKDQKPKLLVNASSKYDDLWMIPIIIKCINYKYKVYLRHHSEGIDGTVIYAT